MDCILRDYVKSTALVYVGHCRKHGFHPWVTKMPWRRKWQPTPVFLPRKSHGQRSLVGYCPWSRKESDTTEGLSKHATSTCRKQE